MAAELHVARPSTKGMVWTGWVLSVLPSLFLLFDGAMKIVKEPHVIKATAELGFPESTIVPMGILLLCYTVLYLFPRTAVLGAILLTGYLGGAVASHIRLQQGWFPTTFPIVFNVVIWLGLYLRDARLRALVPWRT